MITPPAARAPEPATQSAPDQPARRTAADALDPPTAPTEAAADQVAALNPDVVIETPGKVTVKFEGKASELPAGSTAALDRVAEQLNADSGLRIQLMGYAQSPGDSASQSRRTSLFRALAVRTYLIKKGVRSTRMDVRALGAKSDDGDPNRVDVVIPQG
ncbi:MAG: OmpA family protein [Alphaproteobacteria bacterium]|nr:OmpA family protein [Alphaproteobacteria bacterium]